MLNTALITGGSKRIGRSVSLELAGLGYDIALHYNLSFKEAVKTKSEIQKLGVKCELFKSDLSKISGSSALIKKVVTKFPNLNILVNNASIFEEIRFLDVTEKHFDLDFNINFKSPFFLSQNFAKNVSGGMIINMLDARISKIHNAHFVYNLSKKSLHQLTLMLARELGPEIRVNAICPGPILPATGDDGKKLMKIAAKTPLKKIGDTSYINHAVRYLITNKFITGEVLFVDGGQHI
ncbi:MAG: SDR family oxidoreductase [Thermodesulfobacteriota bacterium]